MDLFLFHLSPKIGVGMMGVCYFLKKSIDHATVFKKSRVKTTFSGYFVLIESKEGDLTHNSSYLVN